MVGESERGSGGCGVEQAGHLQEPVRPLFGLPGEQGAMASMMLGLGPNFAPQCQPDLNVYKFSGHGQIGLCYCPLNEMLAFLEHQGHYLASVGMSR